MTSGNAMRQLEERHVAMKIDLMVWSTKMDLLALSYASGEVVLHRLNWLKVWVLAPPGEDLVVKGIAWRPDGKVIAVGYSNNEIYLVDVENKEVVNKTKLDGEITSLSWTQDKEDDTLKKQTLINQKLNSYSKESLCKDECNTFLPKLPPLSRSFGPGSSPSEDHVEDAKKIKDQKSLNLLLVGLNNGKLYISVFGLFPSAVIDVRTYVGYDECVILDSNVSKDFNVIFVVVSTRKPGSEKHTISVLLLNSDILSNNCRELRALALKYGHIISGLDYLNQTLQNITESWENILIEMDSKLTAYASKVPPGRVSSDFLELLMFGTPSPEMGVFLLQDLTERGLKKMGNAIELNYINMQKLVFRHLHSVGQNLSFHVNELCGLSRCPVYFQLLGVNEECANAAFISTGSFLIKATEMQQVIDDSLKKYKAFFRWLYSTILRLSDDRGSPDIIKMSQQDLQYLADYLYNFEGEEDVVTEDGSKKPKFNLEKLGQYLLDKPLDIVTSQSNEYWTDFLEKNPVINKHPFIIPHHKEMSLVQEMKHLEEKIGAVFRHSETFIGQHFKLLHAQDFIQVNEPSVKLTNTYVPDEHKFLFAVLDSKSPSKGFYMVEVPVSPEVNEPRCAYLSLADRSDPESSNRIIDMQFYLPDVLSILMDQKNQLRQTGFVQLPIKPVKDLMVDCSSGSVSIQHLLDSYVRHIDGIVASGLAVSGARKVSVILSENRRKVKLFEMEVEEEEDDDEVMETSASSYKESETTPTRKDTGLSPEKSFLGV